MIDDEGVCFFCSYQKNW